MLEGAIVFRKIFANDNIIIISTWHFLACIHDKLLTNCTCAAATLCDTVIHSLCGLYNIKEFNVTEVGIYVVSLVSWLARGIDISFYS